VLQDSKYGDNNGRWVNENTFACQWSHGNWFTDGWLAKWYPGVWYAKFDDDGAHTGCSYRGDWNNDDEVVSWKPNGVEPWKSS